MRITEADSYFHITTYMQCGTKSSYNKKYHVENNFNKCISSKYYDMNWQYKTVDLVTLMKCVLIFGVRMEALSLKDNTILKDRKFSFLLYVRSIVFDQYANNNCQKNDNRRYNFITNFVIGELCCSR